MAEIIHTTRYWERLQQRIDEERQKDVRAHIDDAIRRVTAAGDRIRREREERVVVDDFVERRERQRGASSAAIPESE